MKKSLPFSLLGGILAMLLTTQVKAQCNSNFTNVTYEFITNVTFAGINNSSAGNTGGPVNYTSQVANVTAGGTYPVSVTIDPDANDHIFVFIDWNQNNVLNDAGEVYTVVTFTGAAGPHVVNIAGYFT